MIQVKSKKIFKERNPGFVGRGFRFNWKRWIGYTKKRHRRNRKNVKVADKVFRKL